MRPFFRRRALPPAFPPSIGAAVDAPFPGTPSAGSATMSSEGLHVPRERLARKNLHLHYAISSLMEELEAVDWYRQRADDTDDPELKAILLHNAKEEIEHACMALEWIRRNDPEFDKELREYLFQDGPIVAREQEVMKRK
jgi:ferritin-like protein